MFRLSEIVFINEIAVNVDKYSKMLFIIGEGLKGRESSLTLTRRTLASVT